MILTIDNAQGASIVPVHVDGAGIIDTNDSTFQPFWHVSVGIVPLNQENPAAGRILAPEGSNNLF